MILQGNKTGRSAEVINKPLTRLDIADDKHNDAECPIKITATLHARKTQPGTG